MGLFKGMMDIVASPINLVVNSIENIEDSLSGNSSRVPFVEDIFDAGLDTASDILESFKY